MNKNRYLEKFQVKSNPELEFIIENKEKYNEEAVTASFQLLRERKGFSADLETLENEMKIEKEIKVEAQKKAIEKEKKKSNLTDDPNAPELHSKRVITMFSAIFATIFGAVLLMYNMKQTNNRKGQIQVLVFGILYTIATIIVIDLLNVRTNLAIIFNLAGAIILTEYFWNSIIGKEFKYRKRSWIKPAIVSVIITIPFLLAIIYGG